MQYRPLGDSGMEASVVAFGAWAIGGWMWGPSDEDKSIRSIHAALDAGINFIDTAPMYGMGESERVVGKALADRPRDQVIIATKCSMVWDTDKGKKFFSTDTDSIRDTGKFDVHIYGGPESVRKEVERSLKLLGTDYIDLLQTHWQDPTTPIEETAGEMYRLKDEGKIRAIGCCNASVEQMQAYQAVGPLSSDQEKYSMLDREIEATNLPFAKDHNIAVLAYSPLGQGLLTGKLGPERVFHESDLRSQRPRYTVENRTRVQGFLQQIQPIADAHSVTLAQLTIAWTLSQPGLTHVLAGARTDAQSIENAAAGDLSLSSDEITKINQALEDLGDLEAAMPPRT